MGLNSSPDFSCLYSEVGRDKIFARREEPCDCNCQVACLVCWGRLSSPGACHVGLGNDDSSFDFVDVADVNLLVVGALSNGSRSELVGVIEAQNRVRAKIDKALSPYSRRSVSASKAVRKEKVSSVCCVSVMGGPPRVRFGSCQ